MKGVGGGYEVEKKNSKINESFGWKKKVVSKKSFFSTLTGTLAHDRRVNFGAVLSNSCRQQRKLQKKKRCCRRSRGREAGVAHCRESAA